MANSKRKKSIRISIIYASIFIALNILGIGYGCWVNNIAMETVISTGDIAPIFSGQPIVTEFDTPKKPDESENATAVLSADQKTMYVSIPSAYPGYSIKINYAVSNMGSIPIKCKISSNAPEPIIVDFSDIDGFLKPHGGSKNGKIKICIPKGVNEGEDYSFGVNLQFEQYNLKD